MRKKKHSKKKVKDGEMDIDRQPSRQANVNFLELIGEESRQRIKANG